MQRAIYKVRFTWMKNAFYISILLVLINIGYYQFVTGVAADALEDVAVMTNPQDGGPLEPKETFSRRVTSLDGLWEFVAVEHCDCSTELSEVTAVPAAYNDLTATPARRYHLGWVCYRRQVVTPTSADEAAFLHFESVNYYSEVYWNDNLIATNAGGHLPFSIRIPKQTGNKHCLVVRVNNTLSYDTIPPGMVEKTKLGTFYQVYQFDFFNYAGILRPVLLYHVPHCRVVDISAVTTALDLVQQTATLEVTLDISENCGETVKLQLALADDDKDVSSATVNVKSQKTKVILNVKNATPWWPRGQFAAGTYPVAFLYQLTAILTTENSRIDEYSIKVGLRTVAVNETAFLINTKPFYCKGVGRHEDWPVHGRGYSLANIVADHALLAWLGANCFRTSHYPYAREHYHLADRDGVVIIDEVAAVGLVYPQVYTSALALQRHKDSLRRLYGRDKNHPSVIAWSVANEPKLIANISATYFASVFATMRELDTTRPVTYAADWKSVEKNTIARLTDFACVNRYYGWYHQGGQLALAGMLLIKDLRDWHKTLKKPVLMTEYGADAVAGLHSALEEQFSEEYQRDLLTTHHEVFDQLRKEFLIGEMVWNLADFSTVNSPTRVAGNKKGLFTRDRQPKTAAYLTRDRYRGMRQPSYPDSEGGDQVFRNRGV